MKTSKKSKKDFDAVLFMRQSREKISKEICDLATEQILEYFKKHTPVERIVPGVLGFKPVGADGNAFVGE